MSKLRIIILGIVLVAVIVFSALFAVSLTQSFPFTTDLNVIARQGNGSDPNEPTYVFDFNDSNNRVGIFTFRLEPAFPNGPSSHDVYTEYMHLGNTKLDSITFQFNTPGVSNVYLDMGDPIGVSYISTRGYNSYTVTATFYELGTLQGANYYKFILTNLPSTSSLSFYANIRMHYMTPLQLTALRAQMSIQTTVP